MKKVVTALALGMLIGSSTVALAAPTTVQATLQKFRILVDGLPTNVTSNQLVYKGTTYVPIRETAELFHYDTRYDGKSKSIEFLSKESYSEEWVSISDFAILNNFQLDTTNNVYKVTLNTNTKLSVNSSNLPEGELTTVLADNGKVIRIQKSSGIILLNKYDLKNAGFKI